MISTRVNAALDHLLSPLMPNKQKLGVTFGDGHLSMVSTYAAGGELVRCGATNPAGTTRGECHEGCSTATRHIQGCPEWKPQQKILWAEVKKETGRWKDRWKVRDLLADGRCSGVVLDFLSTTDVGRRVPGVEELEVWEWMEEQGARAGRWALGELHCSYPLLTSWRPQERLRRGTVVFPSLFPL